MSSDAPKGVIDAPKGPIDAPREVIVNLMLPKRAGERVRLRDPEGRTLAVFSAEPIWETVSMLTGARILQGLRWERVKEPGEASGDQA